MGKRRYFTTGNFYHVFNRGVAKQDIFHTEADFRRFLLTLCFYLERPPFTSLSSAKKRPNQLHTYITSDTEEPLVTIHAYCLMPNHFHLLLQQEIDNGLSTFLRKLQLSYTRYYNTRYDRVGPLLQGTFRSVPIENDQQLLHVSRYIHLNPFVAKLVQQAVEYQWSSLQDYLGKKQSRITSTTLLQQMTGSSQAHREFVEDYASYAQDLHELKHSFIDA